MNLDFIKIIQLFFLVFSLSFFSGNARSESLTQVSRKIPNMSGGALNFSRISVEGDNSEADRKTILLLSEKVLKKMAIKLEWAKVVLHRASPESLDNNLKGFHPSQLLKAKKALIDTE